MMSILQLHQFQMTPTALRNYSSLNSLPPMLLMLTVLLTLMVLLNYGYCIHSQIVLYILPCAIDRRWIRFDFNKILLLSLSLSLFVLWVCFALRCLAVRCGALLRLLFLRVMESVREIE